MGKGVSDDNNSKSDNADPNGDSIEGMQEDPTTTSSATKLDAAAPSSSVSPQDSDTEHDAKHAPSLFGMIRSRSFKAPKLGNVFGRQRQQKRAGIIDESLPEDSTVICKPGEYAVRIEREMLGLTVENVLERTVVRTVLALSLIHI